MSKIFIYTSLYPYSQGSESFLNTEMNIASKFGYDITLIPMCKDPFCRNIPNGVSIDNALCDCGFLNKLNAFCRIFYSGMLSKALRDEDKPQKPTHWIDFCKYLYGISLVYFDVKQRARITESCVFYSYWMFYAPAAFVWYKRHNSHCVHKFVTRGHGSDIYATIVGTYLPMRHYMMSGIDAVYSVSNYGLLFLKKRFPLCQDKIFLSRLGVCDNSSHVSIVKSGEKIKLISCAYMVPLKRIPLLYRSIRNLASANTGTQFVWRHFGIGPEYHTLMAEIARDGELNNLEVEMMGQKSNEEILLDYRENGYNCFLSVSTSEGIPVSMMEAISSGIPIVATDVGGVSEIVTPKTGKLITVDFSQKEFDEAVLEVIGKQKEYNQTTHCFFEINYNAETNYLNFYKSICQ